ncbi:alpha/beta hydrolase [Actinocorallia sp. A-T 12471]|uniref:alpha/beta fold hydrolase n=1 Tax=Actinocorallia sp. A-T 12471 TaxID=3089813 RepID=UPI0029CFE0C3|nr:alpha/beta hydrolase [Actinocorallia sp. A-T 12471]MDX6739566.1 alpha/beta hydrolase [Actinocorallia sp. A-T 12471]
MTSAPRPAPGLPSREAGAALPHFRSEGNGPLLLCLHGIGNSSASFDAQFAAFSSVMRVVAWDAPGYASSPPLSAAPGMDGYADLAASLIRELGHDDAVVLGMSWGGVIAARLAQRHPSLVRALVLGDSTRGSAQSPAQAAAMRARPDDLAVQGPDAFAAARARRLLRPDAPPAEVEAATTAMASAIRLPGYAHAAHSMATTNLDGALAAIKAPTLILYGASDNVTGRPEAKALATQIPNAALREIPAAGHLANQENPTAFNTELSTFLTTL